MEKDTKVAPLAFYIYTGGHKALQAVQRQLLRFVFCLCAPQGALKAARFRASRGHVPRLRRAGSGKTPS